MATGRGSSLGAALLNLYDQLAEPRRSYTAKGWHAQLSALTATERGRAALDATGIKASKRTLLSWLGARSEPRKGNRELIAEAYRAMARGFNRGPVQKKNNLRISGLVALGSDSRLRGSGGRQAPLLVDGSRGDWSRIEREYNSGNTDADKHEGMFVDDVFLADPAFKDGYDPEFPGSWYEVEV